MTRIAIVDDDQLFRESLEQNFRDTGYEVFSFDGGPTALEFFASGALLDLVVLDWRMPDMTGIEVLRTLRARGMRMPAIFLPALKEQIFEEAALTTGAVDFVDKSRSFAILARRISLILDGTKSSEETGKHAGIRRSDLALANLAVDVGRHQVTWKRVEVELTLTEFEVIHRLAARSGSDVSYRELYDLVHGEGFVAGEGAEGYRANVRTMIKRIRQKFRDVDGEFDEIRNYPGFGYRWGGKVGAQI
jgi:two-component system, OmpR family, response regulator ChvI